MFFWWARLLLLRAPLFFLRLGLALLCMKLEDWGVGPRLYRLRFPRDRGEVARDPSVILDLAFAHGAVPDDADRASATLRLHDVDPSAMADPDKINRTFLLTVDFRRRAGGTPGSVVLCVKTGTFRGPRAAQLWLAAVGFKSREQAFYRHVAPQLRARTGARVPRCFHSDTSPLLTHTFFLLEGITGDVTAVAEGAADIPDAARLSFLREEARCHAAFWGPRRGKVAFDTMDGSVLPGIIATSGVLRPHRALLTAAFEYSLAKCPQSLVHGDARLGNALLHPDGRATVIDWEVAAGGAPLFDVIYFLWLCCDYAPDGPEDGKHALLSRRDWSFVDEWGQAVRQARAAAGDGGDDDGDDDKYGPMPQQVAVVSLLLWAYVYAIGAAGFATVWEDGNNESDLKAWGRRCRVRIQQFAGSEAAHRQLARALCGGEGDASEAFAERLTQVRAYISGAVGERVWTEAAGPAGEGKGVDHKNKTE